MRREHETYGFYGKIKKVQWKDDDDRWKELCTGEKGFQIVQNLSQSVCID